MNSKILQKLERTVPKLDNRDPIWAFSTQIALVFMQQYGHIVQQRLTRSIDIVEWQDWITTQAGWRSITLDRHALAWNESQGVMVDATVNGGANEHFSEEQLLREVFGQPSTENIRPERSMTIDIFGNKEGLRKFVLSFQSQFPKRNTHLRWYFDPEKTPLCLMFRSEQLPREEMYPVLNGHSLAEFYQQYRESSASILLLIGPPGTGKTTFIRGYLHHVQSNAIVSYDPIVLQKDLISSEFMGGDCDTMVIEDADRLLLRRDEGNDLMQRFLSIGDGLIKVPGKKLIFWTNLDNYSHIDSALLRSGRCFSVLRFRPLQRDEALHLVTTMGMPTPGCLAGERQQFTLAEIFGDQSGVASEVGERLGHYRAGFG